jgi:quercetin 2,3-dioxygenase
MLEIRKAEDIYRREGGWFDARWHFSFSEYRDPDQMGVGPLRVFNDDRLVPGAIWPMHPHQDVEGITYVVEGEFRHQDDVGGGGTLAPGAIQRMTLGAGARHSEQNASPERPLRFLQFWLLPDTASLEPAVEQHQFTREDFRGQLRQVLGPDGRGVVKVHQDATAHIGILGDGEAASFDVGPGRGAYVYVIDGIGTLDGEEVRSGDAAKVKGPHSVKLEGQAELHVIVIHVPLDFERVGVWAS